MTPPVSNVIAWAVGRGWTDVWHLESTEKVNWTMCGRPVPPGRVSRERHGDAPTCKNCRKEADRIVYLKLETGNG